MTPEPEPETMQVTPTAIPDVLIIEPNVFGDARGFFYESFNQKAFNDATGLDVNFVQEQPQPQCQGRAARPALSNPAAPGQTGACSARLGF